MIRKACPVALAALLVLSVAAPAAAAPRSTVERTIQDLDGDHLLEYGPGEDYVVLGGPDDFRPPREGSILNFLQLSDFQIVDEESPARVEFFDTTQRGPFNPFSAAYRPVESLTTQVTEAMVRAAANTTSPITAERLDLAILTGDNADSQQYNETRWFIDILDGHKKIDPNSGIETPACPGDPDSIYDGVRGGRHPGYYEPDASTGEDGDGYSPDPEENFAETGRRVSVRDFPGLLEAANSPFQAVGLDLPWYSAFGNHDALIQGNSPEAYVGPYGFLGEVANPVMMDIATNCPKPIVPPSTGEPATVEMVPPDPRRCFLAKDEPFFGAPAPCSSGGWIQQHFATTGTPVGHGFAPSATLTPDEQSAGYGRPLIADLNNDGYYSFSPTVGLRFVVLDTITDECGSLFCSEGSVDNDQFVWLGDQIETAASMGQYVIVFSHHTLKTTRFPSTDPSEEPIHYGQRFDRDNPTNPQNVSTTTLEDLYCQNPNVIAHVAGHEHENYVRHHRCAADEPPTPGPGNFWHISTAAHIDWPQQTRMIEVIDNGDDPGAGMSLVLTMLDHLGEPNVGGPKDPVGERANAGDQVQRLAGIARELSYNDYQGSRGARGAPEDRNVIIHLNREWPYPSQQGSG